MNGSRLSRRMRSAWRLLCSLAGPNQRRDYGENNHVHSASRDFRKCRLVFFGSNNVINVAPGVNMSGVTLTFFGSGNRLNIGSGVVFAGGVVSFASTEGQISIGARTTLADTDLTIAEPGLAIVIGEDCLFGWGVDIRCGDGHPILDQNTGKKINAGRSIRIGDHVWIAADVQILKGVVIGNNAVVGTRALVTRDVPPHSLAAGVPARVLKEKIDWRRTE